MKLPCGLAAALACTAAATVRPSIHPETTRLILAQRLGVSRFHTLTAGDAAAIQHINTFGGRPPILLRHADDDAPIYRPHVLVWVENAAHDEATVIVNDASDHTRDFTISVVPSVAESRRLLQDLIAQAAALPRVADSQRQISSQKAIIEALPLHATKTYNGYLHVWHTNTRDGPGSQAVADLLTHVYAKAQQQGFSVTAVMMPPEKAHTKRAANIWGTYTVPASESRSQNPEAVLSSNPEPSTSPNSHDADLDGMPTISNAETKGPVRGVLPVCFNTLSACQKTTHNCSSHGECKLLHKGRGSGKDTETVDCYGCACVPTVKHVGQDKGMESKKQVTYWGGPACQKRDISVPFWLFVFSGVVLAFLVSSGIGMLYSMGSEELPSVIGAGVSGPVKK